MLTLKEVQARLKDRNLSEIGRRIGVSPQYMAQLANGTAKNPSHAGMLKISTYLEKNP